MCSTLASTITFAFKTLALIVGREIIFQIKSTADKNMVLGIRAHPMTL